MKPTIGTRNLMLLIVALATLVFFLFVDSYSRHLLLIEKGRISNHARVVSSSLWAYVTTPPASYLELAAEANGYYEVKVLEENGETFLKIEEAAPSELEKFLVAIKLIKVHTLEAPISYEGKNIGKILVRWPNRSIYVLFYIFILLVLMLLAIGLYLKLNEANVFLERRVKQRTAELEREVQERKRTEIELKYQTQKLATHVRHTPLGVVEFSPDFRIVEWNKAAEKIFEYSREEVIGQKPLGLIIPDQEEDVIETIWEKLLHQSGGRRSTNKNLTKSGTLKTCTWYNTPLTNASGEIIGVASLVMDITEQIATEEKNKTLQEQLLQAQKMEAVGNLAGGIAHDFNNLLQSISGYTQLLLIDCMKNDGDCSKLLGIEKASRRASELIKQMLTFSRKIKSNLKLINLNSELEQIRIMLDRSIPKMVAINMTLAPDLLPIKADPVQIEQIILNLAINAQHAMEDGGILSINTSNLYLDPPFCSTHIGAKEGMNVLLEMSDTGSGMDKNTLGRIFEPFFTTKSVNKGSGLGLATVYGIVKAHGAFIECESTLGQGTTFRLYFPAVADRPYVTKESNVSEVLVGGTETILFVDDERTICDIGCEMLQAHGYKVLSAESGERAIEIYKNEGNSIHLVIMDLNMPGMGGLKAIRTLRDLNPDSLILVSSGYTPTDYQEKATAFGAKGFISKPFLMGDFLSKIRQTLDQQDAI